MSSRGATILESSTRSCSWKIEDIANCELQNANFKLEDRQKEQHFIKVEVPYWLFFQLSICILQFAICNDLPFEEHDLVEDSKIVAPLALKPKLRRATALQGG